MQWYEFRSHVAYLPKADLKRVEEAYELGKEAHRDQVRKSGEPYFTHPIAIAHMLADMTADADTIMAALLHDTVEDTELTLREIDLRFDGDVAALIDGVTKLEPEDVAGHPTLDDQVETLRKIFTQMRRDIRVMVIKLVDRLHNLQTSGFLKKERQKEYAQETLDIFVKIADRLSMQKIRDELEGLSIAILDPVLHTELVKLEEENEQRAEKAMKKINVELHETENGLKFSTRHEGKSWGKLRAQYAAHSKTYSALSAVTIVFLCEDEQKCYSMLGLLHRHWRRESNSFQDFINTPMINGYKGLHTTIIMEDGTRIRCKIRTGSMDAYAQVGIATVCFDSEARSLLDYLLPWTQRIVPLARDTADRSEEFFENLQSDILGESIAIHGPNDEHVMIPKGATALDGAFYCFEDDALYLKGVFVDGKQSPLHTILHHASTITIETSDHRTVNRDWLQWANTGLATAKIREALSQESRPKKLAEGKTLLQKIMNEHKRGFIEEFNAESLAERLRKIGLPSLEAAYESIADGHVEAEYVYATLFDTRKSEKGIKEHVTIHFDLDADDIGSIEAMLKIFKQFSINLEHIRFKSRTATKGRIIVRAMLTEQEQRLFVSALKNMGTSFVAVRVAHAGLRFILGTSLLILLWGFDPAVAHFLLAERAVTPVDLTLVRFWSLTAMSAVLLGWQAWRNPLAQVRLPIRNLSLWISVVLLICIAFATYTALSSTLPVHYSIPMTAAGLAIMTNANRKRWATYAVTWFCLVAATIITIVYTPEWPKEGIIATLFAVVLFTSFNIINERYKRQENIQARIAQYFFLMSAISTVITLPLVFESNLLNLPGIVILEMVIFAVGLSGLPYFIYFHLLNQRQMQALLKYSFLIMFTTAIGQSLLSSGLQTITPTTAVAMLIATVAAMVPLVPGKLSQR